MPSREKRAMRRRRGYGVLSALIVLLMLVAAALVVILVNGGAQQDAPGGLAIRPDATDFVDAGSATPEPLVLGADLQTAQAQLPQPSAEPAETVDAKPVAEPEPTEAQSGGNRLIPEVLPGDYYLPIFDRALRTPSDEMMIAITVDDCNEPEVLSQIVEIAGRTPGASACSRPGWTCPPRCARRACRCSRWRAARRSRTLTCWA